jgi:hypothetical protein
MALEGTIRDFGLADILQLIGIQRKTGELVLDDGDDQVTVKFLDGNVVGADTRKRTVEDLLGGVLVSTGRITEGQLQEALRTQKKTLQRLGHILVKEQLISEEDLIDALRTQSLQIVYRLFRWRDGSYSFRTVDDLEYDERHFVPINAETILMEGARMVDEWPIIERRIKSDRMILRKTAAAKELEGKTRSLADSDIDVNLGLLDGDRPTSDPTGGAEELSFSTEESEVLALVNGRRTAAEINERTTLGEFDTYRILADLMTRSLIEEVKRPTAADIGVQRTGLLDRLLQGALNAIILLAVLAALATLNANPLSPWRVAGEDEGTRQLRFYASQARLEQIERAIRVFYLDAGVFPSTLEPLAVNGYVREADLFDPWGRPYGYGLSPGGYQLFGLDASGNPHAGLIVSHRFSAVQRMFLDSVSPGSGPGGS